MIINDSLVDGKFVGVPYRLAGKSFDGADCIGVCLLWLAEQGLTYEYDDSQGPVLEHWWEHKPRRFVDAVLQYGNVVKWSELRKYDILLLFGAATVNRFPTMMGVMVDDRHFLSCTEDMGSHVFMLDEHWKGKYFGAIRLHKVVERGLA